MSPSTTPNSVLRFGVFEADLASGELRKNGVKVKIQELPFRALRLLLAHPGQIVSRDNFRQALWPDDVFVDFDRGISSAIKRLRDALGDSADNPVFIGTVDRRGYRWIAPTHVPAPPQEFPAPPAAATPVPPPLPVFPQWKYILILPILALLFAAFIFRGSYRSANAGSKTKHTPSPTASTLHGAANREAEDFYLKGRFYWNKRTPESLNQAVDAFTQAIVHDPNYAAAYVGLADCYNLLREFSVMPSSEAYPRAFAAAKKAVEIDPQSSEAHASLAFVSFFGMWDAGTADQEFRRSVDLDPNNAKAHHWYATFLEAVHRNNESLIEIDRAQTLDPNSPSVLADKARLLWVAGRHEDALRLLRQVEAAEPAFVSPHRYLKLAYRETGDYPGYLSETKKEALLLHDRNMLAIADAAEKGFAARGLSGLLNAELQQEKKLCNRGAFSPYLLAQTYAHLDNKPEALRYLEVAYDQHSDYLINLASDPAFTNLHDEPAFIQLVSKIGIPPTN